jgi:hypothetical protein
MKIQMVLRIRYLVLLVLGLFAVSLQAAVPVAQVAAVSGGVTVVRSDSGTAEALIAKDKIYLNDLIKTDDQGRVKLLLGDDSLLKVSPASELRVSEMVVGPSDESRTTLNLLKGKLRSLVGKKLGANSRFEVHTSVAVAGVRGTDFEVLALHLTLIRCFEGLVQVGNLNEEVPGTVMLTANTYTQVLPDQAPSQPEFIAPSESIEGKAGVDEQEDGADKTDGTEMDELDDLESELLEDEADSEFFDIDEGWDEPFITGELLEEQLFGDVINGQIDTVVEQPGNSSSLPIDITIPSPVP